MNHGLTAHQVNALVRIRLAWPSLKTVLIGAAAVGVHIPMTWRRTADVDLTVMTDIATLEVELERLGFKHHLKFEQTWLSPEAVRLDILPTSQADLGRGYVQFPKSGQTMSTTGFDLAIEHTTLLELTADASIEVATLPVLAVLKVAAWLDRPAERQRDLEDLGHALSDYLPLDELRRWDDPRLVEVDFQDQSALALGLDISALAKPNHRRLLESFLNIIDQPDSGPWELLARASCGSHSNPSEALKSRLQALRIGLSRT